MVGQGGDGYFFQFLGLRYFEQILTENVLERYVDIAVVFEQTFEDGKHVHPYLVVDGYFVVDEHSLLDSHVLFVDNFDSFNGFFLPMIALVVMFENSVFNSVLF